MGWEFFSLKETKEYMQASSNLIKSMDMESSIGLMEDDTRDGGAMENNMDWAFT